MSVSTWSSMEMDLSWSILDGKKRFFQAFSPACDVRDFWQHDEQRRCYAATVKSTFSGLLLRFRTCRQMPTYLKSELMGKRGAMINDHSLVNAGKSNLPRDFIL